MREQKRNIGVPLALAVLTVGANTVDLSDASRNQAVPPHAGGNTPLRAAAFSSRSSVLSPLISESECVGFSEVRNPSQLTGRALKSTRLSADSLELIGMLAVNSCIISSDQFDRLKHMSPDWASGIYQTALVNLTVPSKAPAGSLTVAQARDWLSETYLKPLALKGWLNATDISVLESAPIGQLLDLVSLASEGKIQRVRQLPALAHLGNAAEILASKSPGFLPTDDAELNTALSRIRGADLETRLRFFRELSDAITRFGEQKQEQRPAETLKNMVLNFRT